MKLKEKSFRELINQYVYIEAADLAKQLKNFFAEAQQATGVLCYCYLEHEAGMQFAVLCCARFGAKEQQLKLFQGNDNQLVKLPYATICEAEVRLLPQGLPRLEEFKNKTTALTAQCLVSAAVAKTRQLTALDHLRSADCPDNVLVHLVHGDIIAEAYVRLEGVTEMNLYGTLVDEPQAALDVHAGDSISFYLVKNVQGIMCLAMV